MSMIPTSNVAGNNQTTPTTAGAVTTTTTAAGNVPGAATQTTNPYATTSVLNTNTTHGQNSLLDQWQDIYGQGTGDQMYNLFSSWAGGVGAGDIEQLKTALAPQFAASQSALSSKLGAQGVGANSSVNAIAQSNLSAQENATIASEATSMEQENQKLMLSMLQGTQEASASEVASSGWDVFGSVLSDLGAVAGTAAKAFV